MQEWETEMDKGSQPTATQKAVWTYLLKTTPFNKTSLNKGSSQIIQKHKLIPLLILISWGSVIEE